MYKIKEINFLGGKNMLFDEIKKKDILIQKKEKEMSIFKVIEIYDDYVSVNCVFSTEFSKVSNVYLKNEINDLDNCFFLLSKFNGRSIEIMRDSASRKTSSGTKKPTATQIANETRKEVIMEILRESIEPLTATDIMKTHDNKVDEEEMKLNSNQRASALLKQLIEEGKVVKEKTGNKTLFHAIDADTPTEG